jgi:hypothetical protein
MATIEERYDELMKRIQRAEIIFNRWGADKMVAVSEVWRVFRGNYHYYVTFSRTNAKVGADKFGYVTVIGADDEEHAAEVARSKYGGYIKDVEVEYDFNSELYNKGEFGRIVINGDEIGEAKKVPVKS